MITAYTIEELAPLIKTGSAVAWGTFDGVHIGHQALIKEIVSRAKEASLTSVALTFDPRPAVFFKGNNASAEITSTADKLELLQQLGVEATLVLPFNDALAALSPEKFLTGLLLQQLQAKIMILGYDSGFGQGRQGNLALLQKLQLEYDFVTDSVTPVTYNELASNSKVVISSTRIREYIQAGQLEEVAAMLGRRYSVNGPVSHGYQRGKTLLGFPTANLTPGNMLLPPPGVYACIAKHDNSFCSAAVNLGYNPSFAGSRLSLEAHLLDFTGDLYNQELRIYFIKYIRPEKKFSCIDELKIQIQQDINKIRKINDDELTSAEFPTLYPL